MLAAYRFGLEMRHARCADFRDAIIDALAEHLDLQNLPEIDLFRTFFKVVDGMPRNTTLERLLVFHTALTLYPEAFNTMLRGADKQFKHLVREQIKEFPKDVRYCDIWDDFLLNRCKFHEHPTGRCWRPAESGPEIAPPEDEEMAAIRERRKKFG
jgi:hypothetical protein